MGKFDGVLLASDFDDTLYPSNITGLGRSEAEKRAEAVVTGRNKAALDYFLARGGRFTVATGRIYRTFSPYRKRVPMNAPAVLGNGAILYDFDRDVELFHAKLPVEIVEHARRLAKAMPTLGFESHLDEVIYTYRPNEITQRHLHKLGCPFEELEFGEMPQPWTKLLIQHREHAVLAQAQAWLNREYPGKYEAIFSNDHLLEVTAAGANKGQGVLRLAALLGVERENLYCIGDNQNDLPMLKAAALGFAPANCSPALREWGAKIVSPCTAGAIADVIDCLDRRY